MSEEKPPCFGNFMKCPAEKIDKCEWRVDCYEEWSKKEKEKVCAVPTGLPPGYCEECM